MNLTVPLDFTRSPLADALQVVQADGYASAHPELTPAEKALVYYYTDTGSTAINRALHVNSEASLNALGQELAKALRKLPVHMGTVYSAAHLTPAELRRLTELAAVGHTLEAAGTTTWPAYLSASRSRRVAKTHGEYPDVLAPKNCLLVIRSKTGRNIEELSCYGSNGKDPFDSEQEVLFLPDTRFAIVGADFATNPPILELVEI